MLSYSIINKLEKSNGKFNYISYVFKRWLRLSVSHFGSILIIYLTPLTGNGPIWHKCNQLLQPKCKSWTSLMSNIFYYNNWNEAINDYPLDDIEFLGIVSRLKVDHRAQNAGPNPSWCPTRPNRKQKKLARPSPSSSPEIHL
jgi:hypothetical protein